MRVTTWTEYSLLITLNLARNNTRPVPARAIAEEEDLPPDYTEQICLRLRRAGLVQSARGAKGGYMLAKDPGAITIRDVMTACEGTTFALNCETHPVNPERCGPEASCSIRPVWRALRRRIDNLLASVTLADLLKDESEVNELVELGSGH
ncbi:MAG: Rrf2 family transcriptional regulator [Gemmatimonadales bacterium]|nr:Rrf2 family transcriptional regulator [Gemmatimonadales bacterium]